MQKIISVILLVFVLIASVYLWISNPSMTNLKLLLNYKFEYFIITLAGIVSLILQNKEEENKNV